MAGENGPMADARGELPIDPDAPATDRRHLPGASVLLVAAGGFAGTVARYGLELAAPAQTAAWPWGTFAANLAGAFVLGVLLETLARSGPDVGRRRQARLLGGTGFCGGLTTYSTFAVEADLLVRADRPGLAVGYLLVTLAAGLIATGAGIVAGTARRTGDRKAT